jgi:hypothetical protein
MKCLIGAHPHISPAQEQEIAKGRCPCRLCAERRYKIDLARQASFLEALRRLTERQ